MKWGLVILIQITSHFFPMAYAASLTVTDWTYNLPSNITNAGEYYPSILENELPTTAHISISGLNPGDTWTLKASTSSSSEIAIDIKRTTGGEVNVDSGILSGGESYINLTSAQQTIFTGTGNWNNIPLLFKISNLDVTDGYGNKNLPIQYSLTTP